jgi:DNA-binding PadR family transcriptional regulator
MAHGHKDWQGWPGWENIQFHFGPGGPGGPGGRGRGKGGGWGGFGPEFGEAIGSFVNEAIGGAMRGRRMFDGGELRLVLLKLIEQGPRHGYDLIRAIEDMTGGAYAPSPGIVYPTLTLLADMELIAEQESEGARKLFAITEAGRNHLADRAEEVEALFARLGGVGAMRERTSRGPVRRALGNVKSAIHGRMASADEHGELSHEIAAILDEAARRIERLP